MPSGIAQSPEGRRIFPRLTVPENLEMGAYTRTRQGRIARDIERVFDAVPAPEGAEQADRRARCRGGEQQMLAIGRALMARPKLLLLDEPSLGLAPCSSAIFEVIARDQREGTTILLVEQNANAALEALAPRGYVLETGES